MVGRDCRAADAFGVVGRLEGRKTFNNRLGFEWGFRQRRKKVFAGIPKRRVCGTIRSGHLVKVYFFILLLGNPIIANHGK